MELMENYDKWKKSILFEVGKIDEQGFLVEAWRI